MNTTFDHARCLASLPAFLGGTLSSRDAAAVVAHTGECADCHAELEIARRVRTHFAREWRGVAPLLDDKREQDSFDQLWARITAESPAADPPPAQRRDWTSRLTALAAAALIATGGFWYLAASTPQYRTLADPTPRGCIAARIEAAPQRSPVQTRELLEATGAVVVDGPNAQGVYTLRAPNPAESLRQLRALPDVRLAEPSDC
jgi:hypothetical protein